MRRQIIGIVLASVVVTTLGLSAREEWRYREARARRLEEIREQASHGRPPSLSTSTSWRKVDGGIVDGWAEWRVLTYRPGGSMVCWAFLVLPRGVDADTAWHESSGVSSCNDDGIRPYAGDPLDHACRFQQWPPWGGRFAPLPHDGPSPCLRR